MHNIMLKSKDKTLEIYYVMSDLLKLKTTKLENAG